MSLEVEGDVDSTVPVWAAFGDLMSVLLGVFVLILVGVIGVQLHLEAKLAEEIAQREVEQQRRVALEQALAAPLASGRITLVDGRIGISGSVLFALGSDHLQPDGEALLESLATPLADFLAGRAEILMVSGFTDDRLVRGDSRRYADNWELSAQRALTVTRALVAQGVPASSVFAAAFGAEQPVDSNAHAEGRARNRRVEMAPVPRQAQGQEQGTQVAHGR